MGALSFDALLRSLKRGAPDPVYYLHGDEDVLKDEAVRALLERAVDPAARDFNIDQRWAPDLDPEAFHALVNTPPMLAATRAVVLRGCEQLKKAAKLRQELLRYLASPNPTTVLVLEKVAAAVGTRPASREDVAALVGVRGDATLQDFVDALCERHTAAAARLIEPVLEQPGMSGVRMLGALGTNLVGTALARAERDRGTPQSRLEGVLLTHLRAARPYGLGSWERTAASWARWAELWRAHELENAVRLALAADRALKSGTLSDEAQILEHLVLSLAAARREAA